MSRIGKCPVSIPDNVDITIDKNLLTVKGPKGTLNLSLHYTVSVSIDEKSLVVSKSQESKMASAMWGTTTRLITNMITGVTDGFSKKLELSGVGFRMALKGDKLDMALGFSHPVLIDIPKDLTVSIEGMTLTVSGIDRQRVGQFAAEIRALKPVEPYKGKGFRYNDEHVRRKEGKKAAA